MLASQIDVDNITKEQVHKLLFNDMEDDGKIGDCIFVFGSRNAVTYRVPKAVELYKEGRAAKILFTGGVFNTPESKTMKSSAIQAGVADSDIMIETRSKHTKENVISALFVLDRALGLHRIHRMLVVTTHYHMRRCLLTLETYMPDWIEYSICKVDDKVSRADNWWLHEIGTKRVLKEVRGLVKYIRQGQIKDFEL
ncbi:YdcF family protein [Paenibacillus sp. S3N08]|uniref:YdcF family protein n=1 Tax=Paenibacillus agricola TaxID=2716264 RepID=A0ABX0J9J6_9BACL|nr:YdcF family protein [Paenibacillus agricola]